eukprot:scaffold3238_cov79-Isochrysis_galbana.AAC.1
MYQRLREEAVAPLRYGVRARRAPPAVSDPLPVPAALQENSAQQDPPTGSSPPHKTRPGGGTIEPDTVAPGAFTPGAFTPGAFTPGAFTPGAFTPATTPPATMKSPLPPGPASRFVAGGMAGWYEGVELVAVACGARGVVYRICFRMPGSAEEARTYDGRRDRHSTATCPKNQTENTASGLATQTENTVSGLATQTENTVSGLATQAENTVSGLAKSNPSAATPPPPATTKPPATTATPPTVDWHRSTRLLPGSLLALSGDDFETVTWATVATREVGLLEMGQVDIQLTETMHDAFLRAQ